VTATVAQTSTPALPSGAPSRPRNLATLAVLVFGLGGLMAFAALVGAYHALEHDGALPPQGVKLDNYLGVMATFTLALSAPLVEWAWSAVRRDERRQAIAALGLTIGMGVAFIDLDWYLVSRLGFGVATPYGTVFYAMVILAAINAGIGILFLIGAVFRVLGGQASGAEPEPVRVAAWYWEFVVVAWVVVALTLYPIVK
jgi:heme/copper-type cytochrome/quinol oxidase subunit 3